MNPNSDSALEIMHQAEAAGQAGLLTAQLKKDYERANIPFPLESTDPGEINPEEVIQRLRENLYYLLMEQFDAYLNLMYAADVREREFRNIRATDAVDVAGQLTVVLLRREWEKIRMRSRYGGGMED
jgi:hypothetical protein